MRKLDIFDFELSGPEPMTDGVEIELTPDGRRMLKELEDSEPELIALLDADEPELIALLDADEPELIALLDRKKGSSAT